MNQRWYAVQTRTRAEALAEMHLYNQGFTVYVPRIRKQRRHARRVDTVLAPLFPGYVFVAMDPETTRWRAINGTVGVVSLVQFGGWPAPVPTGVVEAIRGREDENGAVALLPPDLTVGEQVRFGDGALAEHSGLLVEMGSEERVVLLLNLLGRQVRVSAPARTLATG